MRFEINKASEKQDKPCIGAVRLVSAWYIDVKEITELESISIQNKHQLSISFYPHVITILDDYLN